MKPAYNPSFSDLRSRYQMVQGAFHGRAFPTWTIAFVGLVYRFRGIQSCVEFLDLFLLEKYSGSVKVHTGYWRQTWKITGLGSVPLSSSICSLDLHDVFLVPHLSIDLLSIGQFSWQWLRYVGLGNWDGHQERINEFKLFSLNMRVASKPPCKIPFHFYIQIS